MTRYRHNAKAIRNMVCSALAVALVTGCAQPTHVSSTGAAKSAGALDSEVAKAERRVAKTPVDAAARAALAQTYLRAGRFESAVTTFDDAMQLGDTSPQTVLGLALAKVGAGSQGEALAVLDQHRAAIPVSDYGLALALAGETSRGVAVLSEALRNGENTPKLRQNLAYAYALDGRWREARLMAAQDVPADQLDARISQWAMTGKPEDYRTRVAGLLTAPVRDDSGQPEYLALNTGAAAAPAVAVAQAAELPAVAAGDTLPSSATLPDDSASPAVAVAEQGAAQNFEAAFGKTEEAPVPRYSYKPVVQAVPAQASHVAAATAQRPATSRGSHLVQLGSFSSEAGAQRAWNIYVARYPALKNHRLTITQAKVNGQTYWRVSAAGFDSRSAASMCSTVKSGGAGCFAYAAGSPLPGAVKARGAEPMMARN